MLQFMHVLLCFVCFFFCFFDSLLFVLPPPPPPQWRRQALDAMDALQITSSIESRRPFLSKISISKPHSAIVLRRYFLQFKNLYKNLADMLLLLTVKAKKNNKSFVL